jgi:hypothetical protein
MAPVIDVIHPMLAAVVIRKKLGIVEGFPRTIWLLAVSDVIRHGGQQAMGAHHLGDILGVLAAMHIKGNPFHVLLERLAVTQSLLRKVHVNIVARHSLRPILALLDQRLTVNAQVMEVEDPSGDTKPTVH